jgi:hypothetical protein
MAHAAWRAAALAALAAAAIAAGGCRGSGAPGGSAAAGGGPRAAGPRSTAVLTILSPTPGEQVTGGVLHVRLKLTGAEVVPQTSANLRPDKGHIHLSLDGRIVSMAYGTQQDVSVPAGIHLLTAEFVATDHLPFNPRVVKTVTFEAR